MLIYFIDFQVTYDIVEICIMLTPLDAHHFTTSIQMFPSEMTSDSIFYALRDKVSILRGWFPNFNIMPYSKQLRIPPDSIICVFHHGLNCAYKRALSMCVDYFN